MLYYGTNAARVRAYIVEFMYFAKSILGFGDIVRVILPSSSYCVNLLFSPILNT